MTEPDLKTKVMSYLTAFPIEAFREPGGDCIHYERFCSGSYYPNSSHSGYDRLMHKHGEISRALPKNMQPSAGARFCLGYGVNEMRDFVGRRENLFHTITLPGDAADVFDYNYYPAREIAETAISQDEDLLVILRGASETVLQLHKDMNEGAQEMHRDLRQLGPLMVFYASDRKTLQKPYDDVREAYVAKFESHVKVAEKSLIERFTELDNLLLSRAQ